jgi:hypothetical protein
MLVDPSTEDGPPREMTPYRGSNTLQCPFKARTLQKITVGNVTLITFPTLNPSYRRSIKTSCPPLQAFNSED